LVRIDLTGTPWENRAFPRLKKGIDDNGNPVAPYWLHCFTQEKMFLGAGDPARLGELLKIFLNWAEGDQAVR
jgi:hypothetical protein